MRLVVIAVGRVKERGLRDAIDDYAKRIQRYTRLSEIQLEDTPDVAGKIAKAIPERARVVALEVAGQRMSSEQLAKLVEQCEIGAVPSLVFLVGGSYGLPPELSRTADVQLSLSDMTLPHRLARLILFEQIYRAFTILRHEPYSH